MEPRTVTRAEVEREPYILWNRFIDLIACGDPKDMTDIQRKASLCFWYDSEIQNGGHLQYFENMATSGGTDYGEVVEALQWLGATAQADIFRRAVALRRAEKRGLIKSVLEYVRRAKEGKYDALDVEYYACKPEITSLLQDLLRDCQQEFVLVQD